TALTLRAPRPRMDRILLSPVFGREWRTAVLCLSAIAALAMLFVGVTNPAGITAWITSFSPATGGFAIGVLVMMLLLSFIMLLRAIKISRRNLRITAALDNMTQGLCMFNAAGRLMLCNEPYLTMYGLTRKQAHHGVSLRELLEIRTANGTFHQDIDD